MLVDVGSNVAAFTVELAEEESLDEKLDEVCVNDVIAAVDEI